MQCKRAFRALARRAARRDEKPRPRDCRAGDLSRGSDRHPLEPREDRRRVAGRRAKRAQSSSRRAVDRGEAAARRQGEASHHREWRNAEVNQALVELIKEAFAIRNQLLSGSDDSIEAMSARLGMNKFRLTSLVRLSYLAPGIAAAPEAVGISLR